MKRVAAIVGLGALMLALAAGVALAVLDVGNNNPNTLTGTNGDNKGQDTLFGLGAGDRLVGRSAADQLSGGTGPDRLEGNEGNDTLVGGEGEDRIFTGKGFDFVFAADGDRDVVNCNGEGNYRIIFDKNLDQLEHCPGANTDAKASATGSSGRGIALSIE
jgi:Ca2+-binding RTX toxin-like protein